MQWHAYKPGERSSVMDLGFSKGGFYFIIVCGAHAKKKLQPRPLSAKPHQFWRATLCPTCQSIRFQSRLLPLDPPLIMHCRPYMWTTGAWSGSSSIRNWNVQKFIISMGFWSDIQKFAPTKISRYTVYSIITVGGTACVLNYCLWLKKLIF